MLYLTNFLFLGSHSVVKTITALARRDSSCRTCFERSLPLTVELVSLEYLHRTYDHLRDRVRFFPAERLQDEFIANGASLLFMSCATNFCDEHLAVAASQDLALWRN